MEGIQRETEKKCKNANQISIDQNEWVNVNNKKNVNHQSNEMANKMEHSGTRMPIRFCSPRWHFIANHIIRIYTE